MGDKNDIDKEVLLNISDTDLATIVPKIGHRVILRKRIEEEKIKLSATIASDSHQFVFCFHFVDFRENDSISSRASSTLISEHSDQIVHINEPFQLSPDNHLLNITLVNEAGPSTSQDHGGIDVTNDECGVINVFQSIENLGEQSKPKRARISSFATDFNLEEVLRKSRTGQAIINIYKLNQILDSASQSYLVDIIVSHCLNNECWRLTNDDFKTIASKVNILFPNENTDVYYCPPVHKRFSRENRSEASKGKLVDKYKNKITYLRKAGVVPLLRYSASVQSEVGSVIASDLTQSNEYIWLKNNIEPWQEVQTVWNKTYLLRTKSFSDEKV
ncbi:uncharacterized protein LOC116164591 [Photinus pyralis]|uniref:uncharacterized protein LOC116162009 n=1 Tax=Photinus pyralis TaxID=7054 RepID=UPI0012670527|nr:uncharacterized protein LOC116162009 [Photinus pyralis]XP_031334647.1 uncharacterized protein LOC116164591 [Photinus pyralis]